MISQRPLLSIVTPCYNEDENIHELYRRIKASLSMQTKYEFEIIFIDNNSRDGTLQKLKKLAASDPMVKIIVNTRNFGHIRSPYYGILQSSGLATIYMASDLQDPPEMLHEFIKHWEDGYKLVMATKPVINNFVFTSMIRKVYYRLLDGISDISILKDSSGFGLYDQVVLNHLRKINDPYPYLRGLICELGYEIKAVSFNQPRRLRGISKNNFYTLYDIAMLGIVSHSKLPLRIAAFLGFLLGTFSVLSAIIFLILKLIYWDSYTIGMAPLIIGLFFMFGIQLIFIGLLGEYIASIHSYQQQRPIIVEKERINFD
jgi:dolichol-phosphate mannosyltransferase